MKVRILNNSLEKGFNFNRLPEFTREEIRMIEGSSDFLGLNYYTASMVANEKRNELNTLYDDDVSVRSWKNESWPASASKRLKVCNYYNFSVIFITILIRLFV